MELIGRTLTCDAKFITYVWEKDFIKISCARTEPCSTRSILSVIGGLTSIVLQMQQRTKKEYLTRLADNEQHFNNKLLKKQIFVRRKTLRTHWSPRIHT